MSLWHLNLVLGGLYVVTMKAHFQPQQIPYKFTFKHKFYDIHYMKNDDNIFKLEKETFLILLLSSVNQMKVASLFLNLKTI